MIRTVKKMIEERLRHYKTKTWVEVLKTSLNRYNNQIHSSTKTTPNNAHNFDNVIQVRTNLVLKEKPNRKYPNIREGDYVKIFDKGKGNYLSRKETRSQWSERKYKVILVGRDMMNNKYYKLDGMSKRYNRHELLLVDYYLFFSPVFAFLFFWALIRFFSLCIFLFVFISLFLCFRLYTLDSSHHIYLYFSSVFSFLYFVFFSRCWLFFLCIFSIFSIWIFGVVPSGRGDALLWHRNSFHSSPTNNTSVKTTLIIFNIFTFSLFELLSVLAWAFFNKNHFTVFNTELIKRFHRERMAFLAICIVYIDKIYIVFYVLPFFDLVFQLLNRCSNYFNQHQLSHKFVPFHICSYLFINIS